MRKDPTEFRKRFAAWKDGKLPYEAGLPKYKDGKGETVTDYPIPFIKDKVVKLTDAGLATGAVFSTNLLDSIADNADRAGLDLLTALGLATKESTLGNPTDDRSMRTLLSALKQKELTDYLLEVHGLSYDLLFGLHINRGDIVQGQELINWYKDENNIEHKPSPPLSTTHPDRKSVIQKAFEFYKQHPDKYNPGQKNYQRLVDKRGAEVMLSPEVLKWLKERNIKKATGRFNRLNPLLNESKFNPTKYKDGKLPGYKDGDESITVGEYNVHPSAIGASELSVTTPEVVVTGKDKRPLYLRYDAERSVYNPNDVISGFNALTLGGMNNLSPTQWARRFYDAPKLFSGDMSFSDYTNRWLNGNEGIVSREFAKNHPYYSAAINMAGDVGSLLLLKSIPSALRFIDRGFVPQKNILSQTDNTMTRYIGTGDSGYKDALMSDVIRGNINPPRFSAAELAKLRKRFNGILSEDDFRDLASNNIRSEEQFNRINDVLSDASASIKVGRFNFGKDYSLADSWEDYLLDNIRNQNLTQKQAYMQTFSKSKEINDWIKNWRISTDKNTAKGHPLPTFALLDEVLTNSRLFPGDYAVQIKNADKYARTAQAFGHFKEHPTTYRPMSPFEEDVTLFKRQDGFLTGHKYMVKVPKSQMAKDKSLYSSNAQYAANPTIRRGAGMDYLKLLNMLFNGLLNLLKLQILPFFQNIQTMKSE